MKVKWPGAGVPRISKRWKREWQEAVDGAYALLALDAARRYGLITGGPGVNVGRCRQILAADAGLCGETRRGALRRLQPEGRWRRSPLVGVKQ